MSASTSVACDGWSPRRRCSSCGCSPCYASPSLLLDDVKLPYPDLQDDLHDARAEVARLRRMYAAEPDDDTLQELVDAETRLGRAQRDWEAEARRATFKDPRPERGPARRRRG